MSQFDYESKIWGGHEVKRQPTYLGALRLQYCLEDINDVKGNVLEVGCGAGGMAKALKAYRPDLEVYGCDISRQAIRQAQRYSNGIAFEVGNAYDLPYGRESFSCVVIFDLLEHLEQPDLAVSEIWRVLESGGVFHLFVPCEGDLRTLHGLLARLGWRAKSHYGGHIKLFTERDIREILELQRFDVRNGRWSGHLFNQIVDVLYFSILALRGTEVHSSVESYLAKEKPGMWTRMLQLMKNLIAGLSYYESYVLRDVPGWGIHLACYKGNKDRNEGRDSAQ